MSAPHPIRLACIGDIHTFWDAADTQYFNQSDYAGLLFTGDLPRFTNSTPVARRLAELDKPAWLIPGNHDGSTPLQFIAELRGWSRISDWYGGSMPCRVREIDQALGSIQCGGYRRFDLDGETALITARPHAMGPNRFYFRRYLRDTFGVSNFEDSTRLLVSLIDQAPKRLIFLAHNGPAGLGDKPSDIWGCDFAPQFGDFGDPDLRAAIDYAKQAGKEVLAVVAGHMHHHRKRGSGKRSTAVREAGVLYLNAARVARVRDQGNLRHHVELTVDAASVSARECWVDSRGKLIESFELVEPS